MRHVEVEILSTIVLAGAERDSEAYLSQGNRDSIGDAGEQPRQRQALVGHLQLLERFDRDHVEACTPIKKCLGDGDVVDGGGADEGDCAHSPCGLGVVTSVEGDLVLGPLEGPGGLRPREDGVDLSRDLLEVAVGEGACAPPRIYAM